MDAEPSDGRARVIIRGVTPEVDGGRYPVKRSVGEKVVVEADIFADGRDSLGAALRYRKEEADGWMETPMHFVDNDRWRGVFGIDEVGCYRYTIVAWVDRFASWRQDLEKRVDAGQEDIAVDLLIGAELIAEAAARGSADDRGMLQDWTDDLSLTRLSTSEKARLALSEDVRRLMSRYADRRSAVSYSREVVVWADRAKARFSTWYEMFPRSCAPEPGRHGTFKDCEARLPYVAEMGFDVLYFPPIHPVGTTNRKGKNNALAAGPDDPGTPWATGSKAGGFKAIHPQLGTLHDFQRLVKKAQDCGLEIALDIAFQCSPDHPYVREHPEWFLWRPNRTIQYAENPPKKYQDIYPLNFETDHWQELWEELRSVIVYWIEQGVRIFRVDNPHTKPFRFWEWLITSVRSTYPDVIFLSEAFTRPKVKYELARLGFTQSYTYFAWRNSKAELTQYLIELVHTDVREFFRPSFWTNTPDILTEYLQHGGRPAFMARLVLAATMTANYGIYGPAFELMEHVAREPGSEEYLNSEKYEIRSWDLNRPDSLKDFIAKVNHIRHENPALQHNLNLWFHATDSEDLLCYSKHTEDLSNIIYVVVNLNPHQARSGGVYVPLQPWGIDDQRPYQMHDLLSGARYSWRGTSNYVELNPSICPAHIFRLER